MSSTKPSTENITQASIEITKNLWQALRSLAENPPVTHPRITKLLYDEDGRIIDLTDEREVSGPWLQVDRAGFESKHGMGPYVWLRLIDGKVVDVRPESKGYDRHRLVPGDTWYADREFRLITGSDDSDGWSKRQD